MLNRPLCRLAPFCRRSQAEGSGGVGFALGPGSAPAAAAAARRSAAAAAKSRAAAAKTLATALKKELAAAPASGSSASGGDGGKPVVETAAAKEAKDTFGLLGGDIGSGSYLSRNDMDARAHHVT